MFFNGIVITASPHVFAFILYHCKYVIWVFGINL